MKNSMKLALALVILTFSLPGLAATYRCSTANQSITGDFTFTTAGTVIAATMTYSGKIYVAENGGQGPRNAHVQDFNFKAAQGFYVQVLIPSGVAVLFSAHPENGKLIGTANVFTAPEVMQRNEIACLYYK